MTATARPRCHHPCTLAPSGACHSPCGTSLPRRSV